MKILLIIFLTLYILSVSCDDNDVMENIECGQSNKIFDECFKNMSKSEAELFSKAGIPKSMEEITTRCTVFTKGMKCVDVYASRCLDPNRKKVLENEIYGAKQLFKNLCYDKLFQKNYLRHKECFEFIQGDWDKCAIEFRKVLKEEMGKQPKSNQYFEFCCIKYGYESCVNNAAKYKCRKDSTTFVAELVRILSSEKQYENCDILTKQICSSSSSCNYYKNYLFTIVLPWFLKSLA